MTLDKTGSFLSVSTLVCSQAVPSWFTHSLPLPGFPEKLALRPCSQAALLIRSQVLAQSVPSLYLGDPSVTLYFCCIHSFKKCPLSTYYMQGTALDAGVSREQDKVLLSWEKDDSGTNKQ